MPSHPRYLILKNNSLFHVTWQCHNRDFHLKYDWVKQKYYDLLLKYKDKYEITFFSYCFMSNHPHMTGFVQKKENLSNFFRTVNSQFARFYNKQMRRRGQLVMDRFKSPVIESQGELLKVIFYNDLNPKRAYMVSHPGEYQWTSFHHYAFGKKDPLLTDPQCYLDLGETPEERQKNYREMVDTIVKNDWREKRPYSSTAFIGNPDWVKYRYFQLREEIKKHREERHHLKTAPPVSDTLL